MKLKLFTSLSGLFDSLEEFLFTVCVDQLNRSDAQALLDQYCDGKSEKMSTRFTELFHELHGACGGKHQDMVWEYSELADELLHINRHGYFAAGVLAACLFGEMLARDRARKGARQ